MLHFDLLIKIKEIAALLVPLALLFCDLKQPEEREERAAAKTPAQI